MFFNIQNKQTAFFVSLFIPSLIVLLLALVGFVVLFKQANCLLLVIGVVWCLLQQALAQKKPAHYALVWLILAGLMLALLN